MKPFKILKLIMQFIVLLVYIKVGIDNYPHHMTITIIFALISLAYAELLYIFFKYIDI